MSYAGDVTPEQAHAAVTGPEGAMLVDVRTRAEWSFVGVPVIDGAADAVAFVEWSTFPAGTVNERFVDEVVAAGLTRDARCTCSAARACDPRRRRTP